MTVLIAIAAVIVGTLVWALTAPTSFWFYASRFGVPFLVTAAWLFLAISAETDATGYSWMAVGFAIVIVLWFLFRVAIARAGTARALAIGDHERLHQLAQQRRAPIYRVLALDMQGEWSHLLAELDAGDRPSATLRVAARPGGARAFDLRTLDPTWRFLAEGARVAANVEQRDAGAARAALAAMDKIENVGGSLPTPAPLLRALAEGRVLWAEGKLDDARPKLQRVIDDIRTGAYIRAVAHVYAARIAEARGDRDAAVRERAAARRLAPNTWVASVDNPLAKSGS